MMEHSNQRRRADDPRIDKLVEDVSSLQKQVLENTEVTKQVKEMIGSFKMIATVAKWIAAVVAGYVAIKTGIASFFGKP